MTEESSGKRVPPPPPLPVGPTPEELLATHKQYEAQNKIVEENMADYASICRQKEMQFQLVGAIEKEDTDLVRALIEEGVNTNAAILFTRTPLVHALEDDHEEVAVILIEAGAEVNMTEKTFPFRTPTHFAAQNGMIRALDVLCRFGADVGTGEATSMTPLHFAAWRGQTTTVKWLIENGADVDPQDDFLRTPLHRAVEGNHPEVVKILLSAGADINSKDRFAWTALFHCIICDKPNMVQLLLSNGIEVNTVSHTGNTPLHAACARLRPVLTKILLSAAPDPIRRRRRIPFPYFEEDLVRGDFSSRFDIIEALVDYGADINVINNESFSPLYLALFFGQNRKLVEFLALAGCCLNHEAWLSQDIYRTVATEKGFTDTLDWLDANKNQPPSLLRECRLAIRSALRTRIRTKVEQLPLPGQLKSFLNLEDFYAQHV